MHGILYFSPMRFWIFLISCFPLIAFSQGLQQEYMHGHLTPDREAIDILSYEISISPDLQKLYIIGTNTITCRFIHKTKRIQLDLFENLQIDSIILNHTEQMYSRNGNTFFILLNKAYEVGDTIQFSVSYQGVPNVAKKAPWDGGFVWAKDLNNKPWMGLACEGNGASIWLPCKDHLSDEAERVIVHLNVPKELVGVSNGKLKSVKAINENVNEYTWEVTHPINNYNITLNIGDYVHFKENYKSKIEPFDVDFYVLRGHLDSARIHFIQTFKMLYCYENYFGKYAFASDGYKLVETPYWGMEHQSCISYGNHFKNNEWGFDFIIIHESAHEWFGNSISCNDAADMWIHESFATYAESIFLECVYNKERGLEYLKSQKSHIVNKHSMIGKYGIYDHKRKDNDIYYKGAWMLNTMRVMLNNDELWFSTLKDFCNNFHLKIIGTKDVIRFFNMRTNHDWTSFFNQYLYHSEIPTLEYSFIEGQDKLEVKYRLNSSSALEMPIKLNLNKGTQETVIADHSWQVAQLNYFDKSLFTIDPDYVLISIKEINK